MALPLISWPYSWSLKGEKTRGGIPRIVYQCVSEVGLKDKNYFFISFRPRNICLIIHNSTAIPLHLRILWDVEFVLQFKIWEPAVYLVGHWFSFPSFLLCTGSQIFTSWFTYYLESMVDILLLLEYLWQIVLPGPVNLNW